MDHGLHPVHLRIHGGIFTDLTTSRGRPVQTAIALISREECEALNGLDGPADVRFTAPTDAAGRRTYDLLSAAKVRRP
jgi:hypothetical protein